MGKNTAKTKSGQRRPGSQQALRESNSHRLLQVLAANGPQTQAQLARHTGLSGGTVSNLVRNLSEDGVVQTDSAVVGGRRSVQVSIRPNSRYLLGIDIGRTHLNLLLTDSSKAEVCHYQERLPGGHRAQETLPHVGEVLRGLLATEGIELSSVGACVVALPASVHPLNASIVQDTVFHTWAGLDLQALAEQHLGLPVVLENDANLGALAQYTSGGYGDVQNLMYLKVASGIGVGLVHNPVARPGFPSPGMPSIYSTSTGVVGEIGHTQVMEGGEICYCGNRGCLEVLASARAMIGSLNRIRPDTNADVDSLIEAAIGRDVAVMRLLADGGAAIGRALAPLINVLAPDVIVFGGPLTPIGDIILESVVPAARRRMLPALVDSTRFSVSPLAGQSEVLGCIALASQMLWSSAE